MSLRNLFKSNQDEYDDSRAVLKVVYPSPFDEKHAAAFARSIDIAITAGTSRARGVPTIVFEVVSTPEGITHLLRFPKDKAAYLTKQLRTAIPGVEFEAVDDVEHYQFDCGAELPMERRARSLDIAETKDFANRVLGSMQDAADPGDRVVLQWVISHAKAKRIPDGAVMSTEASWFNVIMGDTEAKPDEVAGRKAKQSDQLFYATGRVAANASDPQRARALAQDVIDALRSEGGAAYFKPKWIDPVKISDRIEYARTPLHMTAELSTDELLAVTALPLGTPSVRGLPTTGLKPLPVPANVPSVGWIIGKSAVAGPDRPVALTPDVLATHLYIGGGTMVGKTTLMEHILRQAIPAGHGAIIIEYEGNLIHKALNQVPPDRLDDVIVVDFANQRANPVGQNIIKQASGSVMAGKLITLFESIYPDTKSIHVRKLLTHVLPALEVVPNATLADVMVVANPKKGAETHWVDWIISQQTDPTIKEFLEDWRKLPQAKREERVGPLDNRIFEILTPRESRYMVNQETSSFDPYDVIRNNRLLFVNFANISESVASIIGSFIVDSLWSAAQNSEPERSNLLMIDEFQYFSRLNSNFEDMLATARRRKLSLVLATQYIERLAQQTQDAIAANARSKIVFQSSPKSASIHSRDFADRSITSDTIINLPAYTALARLNTSDGVSSPMTLRTFPPVDGPGLGSKAIELSDQKYGRPIESIEAAERARRRAPSSPPPTPPKKPGDGGTFELDE
ncbi:TraM recognition domain-containing protein [Rhodococcus aetherivorans]|uniref:TraM recognition domain-containing protein n=1 Tax=Rhodococcus aetherivorans TaxID=191292 RepID=UPI00388FA61D